jgi:hypothetical protein
MNSTPASSSARCNFARDSSETRGPVPASTRLTVGRDNRARGEFRLRPTKKATGSAELLNHHQKERFFA